jgi:transcriptional regulator with GAF, ATPase, and Fis domain
MNVRQRRAIHRGIWGVVCAFVVMEATWAAWAAGSGSPYPPGVLVHALVASTVMLLIGFVSTRSIDRLARAVSGETQAHLATLDQVAQLELSNAVLQVVARSVDVPLAFQALAQRIVRLVPCDRVGLAVLSENGQEFQTYTARVHQQERRTRARPDLVFKVERTALGSVVNSREPLLISDTSRDAADFLDVNVLHSAGIRSALLMPLVTRGRAVGTLNVVSRQLAAFQQHHIQVLHPIAEIFAVAHVAQQLQIAVGRHRSMEAMSELTLAMAAEMNSALQIIIGHCDLLERGYPDPALQRDLATVVHQAQRISALIETMRLAAHERLREVTDTVSQGGIPSSPEGLAETELT